MALPHRGPRLFFCIQDSLPATPSGGGRPVFQNLQGGRPRAVGLVQNALAVAFPAAETPGQGAWRDAPAASQAGRLSPRWAERGQGEGMTAVPARDPLPS